MHALKLVRLFIPRWVSAGWLFIALMTCAVSSSFAADDFLPPEQVFKYTTRVENDQIIVTWNIAKGHYLYKKRMGFESASAGSTLGEPLWPKGDNHHDEFFGDQEVYRGTTDFPVPITFAAVRPATVDLKLKLQGCADAGLCYPPQVWDAKVQIPPASAQPKQNLKSLFNNGSSKKNGSFLDEDRAFALSAERNTRDSLKITWVIAEGYYLYKDKISIATTAPGAQLGKPQLPASKTQHDEYFGDSEVYREVLEVNVPVIGASADPKAPLTITVNYQGCAEAGLCYPPITRTVEVSPADITTAKASAASLPGDAPVSQQARLQAALESGSLAYAMFLFFIAGLLLSLTPCVLPMIPILSGIIVGQGENVTRGRSFSLAFTYVQGMALTYAGAGAIFVLAFKQAPQAFFQQPWIITIMVLLFIALAFAMFGAYTLQMPSAIQTRLSGISDKQKSGTLIGTFIMGALSALVVTACVAPALIAALSVISQSRQILRGAAALYATGLGMGVPLLIVGASAGTLLPKAGPWMETVKQLFGVLFLGVAIYMLQPLIPAPLALLLWSALAVLGGFWIFSLKARSGEPAAAPLRAVGLLAIVYGVLLLIGAASGSKDPLQPLDRISTTNAAGTSSVAAEKSAFLRVKTTADLERALTDARAAGKPVMFDFYADWCVSCKEMEKDTFPDPAVRAALSNAVLLQADVTANDAQDRELLNRFNILGPPSIVFFTASGQENADSRVVGFMKAPEFAAHISRTFAGG
jgi:thiol:disulfide interchange protein DsbD